MAHWFIGIAALFASAAMTPLTPQPAYASTPQPAYKVVNSTLTDTNWRLITADESESLAGFTLKMTRRFADGSSGVLVNASDGCNVLKGTYVQNGSELHIRVVSQTLLACAPPPTRLSDGATVPPPPFKPLAKQLNEATQFRLHGGVLELLDERGTVLLRFIAAPVN